MKPETDPRVDDYRAVFCSMPAASLLLDPHLFIQDANTPYLEAINRDLDEIVGQYIFDAFPPNPGFPEGDGVDKLRDSLEHVLTSRQTHSMGVQRYDIPWSDAPGGFVERYWCPINTPIITADDALVGVLHTVEDVTGYHEDLATALRFYHKEISSPAESAESQRLRFADYAKVAMNNARNYPDVVAEVEGLHDALTSRATIEQAKGIVMVENRCGPDEAFEILAHASQQRNVKVRDLASALVSRASRGLAIFD